jgi:hypothetical protein
MGRKFGKGKLKREEIIEWKNSHNASGVIPFANITLSRIWMCEHQSVGLPGRCRNEEEGLMPRKAREEGLWKQKALVFVLSSLRV